jgi:hypothetical protein
MIDDLSPVVTDVPALQITGQDEIRDGRVQGTLPYTSTVFISLSILDLDDRKASRSTCTWPQPWS